MVAAGNMFPAAPNEVSMRFTRLKLTNWRNFKNVEIRLASRAIFVGPNASGKSNLLDAFRFLHDLAPEGGLALAIQRRHGVSFPCHDATLEGAAI